MHLVCKSDVVHTDSAWTPSSVIQMTCSDSTWTTTNRCWSDTDCRPHGKPAAFYCLKLIEHIDQVHSQINL